MSTRVPSRYGEVENVHLYPLQPTLTLDKVELGDGQPKQVLYVKVRDEKGRESFVHFSVGLNHQGRVVGEVCVVGPNDDTRKKAVASWLEPRGADGKR